MLREEPGIPRPWKSSHFNWGGVKITFRKSSAQFPAHWSSVVLGFASVPASSRAWPDSTISREMSAQGKSWNWDVLWCGHHEREGASDTGTFLDASGSK